MIKKTITFVDYDDNERKEDFWFNLSKAELIEMQMSINGGLEKLLQQIVKTQDSKRLMELLKEIIMKAYGQKSLDGRRFIKSRELSEEFVQTEAYSELLTELLSDADKAAAFINGIIPKALADEVAKHPEYTTMIEG